MSKQNDNLQTPPDIIKALGEFDLDPCAGEHTKIGKVNLWDGRGENGLEYEWNGLVFCNPPFSEKEIWGEKMIQHGKGILLLPERGSAPWFGKLALASRFHFISGKKINFIGGSSSNNVGSVFFLFGYEAFIKIQQSGLPGHLNETKFFNSRIKK